VHVLRNVHQAVAPGGLLLEGHPVVSRQPVESGGRRFGRIDDSAFGPMAAGAEAGLERLAAEGWLTLVGEAWVDVLERYPDGPALVERLEAARWRRLPAALAGALQTVDRPVDIRNRVVWRLYRRL
jgi:hypothetical protein